MKDHFAIVCCIFVTIPILYVSTLYAHGVKGKIGKGGIGIIAEYTTGEPMSYAKVVITAPNKKIPFQIGRTDRNGRFCFYPDMQGMWKIVVEDGMGHRLQLDVPVKHGGRIETLGYTQSPLQTYLSNFLKTISGVSIIFGIFGCIVLLKAYKKMKI